MDNKIVETSDKSNSLYSNHFNETYHSINGAINESEHIFINLGLNYILKRNNNQANIDNQANVANQNNVTNQNNVDNQNNIDDQDNIDKLSKSPQIKIFEMGFGTGLNALLTISEIEKYNSVNNNIKVNYFTIEKYPVEKSIIDKLNYPQLISIQNINVNLLFQKLHLSKWNNWNKITNNFNLYKYRGDINDIIINNKIYNIDDINNDGLSDVNNDGLSDISNDGLGDVSNDGLSDINNIDVIYFDAFSPAVQPELWTEDILQKMYDILSYNGILVTYCAKNQFKKTLRKIGFTVNNYPGPPGKREVTAAVKG